MQSINPIDEIPTCNDMGIFVTIKTVSQYLGISEHAIGRLCRDKEVPAVKVGRQWRIPASWLREQLEGVN